MRADCTTTANRDCVSCTDNTITRGTNRVTCDICPSNYYGFNNPTFKCAVCASSSAGLGNYNRCYNDANGGQREIKPCDGHNLAGSTACSAGYGVSAQCSGTTTTNPGCAMCGAGTERPTGTAMVGTAPAIQACSRCAMGKYKTGTSASDCVGCTNKDQNSAYTAWAVDATPSTNTCPW